MRTPDKNVGEYLRAQIEENRAAHAYIIVGEKSNLSDLLKECALVCMCDKGGCRECETCNKVIKNEHQDVLYFPRDKAKNRLTVADMTYLVEETYKRPVDNSRARVFLIDASDSVYGVGSDLWQNKLLKTLEEPTEGVYIFVGVTDAEALLPTVRSRCQTLKQTRKDALEVKRELMNKGYDARSCEMASVMSDGSVESGERLLLNPNAFNAMEVALDMMENMTSTKNSLKYVSAICSDRENAAVCLKFAAVLLRESIVYRLAEELRQLPSFDSAVKKICDNYTLDAAYGCIEVINNAKKRLDDGGFLPVIDGMAVKMMEIRYLCRQ